jgi:3-hydroxyacyl-[acyl-carrier-protein] dehydratase
MSRSATIPGANLCIDAQHPSLPGHFPGHPLVPAVMQLEAVAGMIRARHSLRIARIIDAKFVAPLEPGVEAEICLEGGPPLCRFEIRSATGVLAHGRVEVCA